MKSYNRTVRQKRVKLWWGFAVSNRHFIYRVPPQRRRPMTQDKVDKRGSRARRASLPPALHLKYWMNTNKVNRLCYLNGGGPLLDIAFILSGPTEFSLETPTCHLIYLYSKVQGPVQLRAVQQALQGSTEGIAGQYSSEDMTSLLYSGNVIYVLCRRQESQMLCCWHFHVGRALAFDRSTLILCPSKSLSCFSEWGQPRKVKC